MTNKARGMVQQLYVYSLMICVIRDTFVFEEFLLITIVQINGKEDTGLQNVDRKELKIATKVFISSPDEDLLKQALDQSMPIAVM